METQNGPEETPEANPVGVLSYYEDTVTPLAWPTSPRRECTAVQPCTSLNCPFKLVWLFINTIF